MRRRKHKGWSEGPKTPLRVRAGAARGTSLLHTLPLLRGPRSPGCPGGLVLPQGVLGVQAHFGPTAQQQCPLSRGALSILGSLHFAVYVEMSPSTSLCSTFWPAPVHPPLLPCLLSIASPHGEGTSEQPDRPQCTGLRARFPGRPKSLNFKSQSQGQSTGSNDKTA